MILFIPRCAGEAGSSYGALSKSDMLRASGSGSRILVKELLRLTETAQASCTHNPTPAFSIRYIKLAAKRGNMNEPNQG